MPFYEYKCSNCGHELEELQSIKEAPLKKCPACGKDTLQKLMGTGAGLIFKGSGFYLTDYKKKSSPGSDSGKTGKKGSKSQSKNEEKKDIKSEVKDTSKSTAKSENSSGETKKSANNKENKKR